VSVGLNSACGRTPAGASNGPLCGRRRMNFCAMALVDMASDASETSPCSMAMSASDCSRANLYVATNRLRSGGMPLSSFNQPRQFLPVRRPECEKKANPQSRSPPRSSQLQRAARHLHLAGFSTLGFNYYLAFEQP